MTLYESENEVESRKVSFLWPETILFRGFCENEDFSKLLWGVGSFPVSFCEKIMKKILKINIFHQKKKHQCWCIWNILFEKICFWNIFHYIIFSQKLTGSEHTASSLREILIFAKLHKNLGIWLSTSFSDSSQEIDDRASGDWVLVRRSWWPTVSFRRDHSRW